MHDVVVGADENSSDAIVRFRSGFGDEHDRDSISVTVSQFVAEGVTAHFSLETDLEQDAVGSFLFACRERLLSCCRTTRYKTGAVEDASQMCARFGTLIDD